MSKREFWVEEIEINGRKIGRVIIDGHVDKHPDVTDEMILDLVRMLDGVEQLVEDEKVPFQYYVSLLEMGNRQYRLVWLLEDNELYIGVITAYRDERRK